MGILPQNEEDAVRLSTKKIVNKFYRLQSEYLGSRKTKVTFFSVSIDRLGEALAFYLSSFGDVRVLKSLRGKSRFTIARYGHVRNGHRMLVTYIHRT